MVAGLQPELQQTLSDSLHVYRTSVPVPLPSPRLLDGPADAPVRITEFTDVRCEHCADLHKTLDTLRESLPAGSFSVEPRQFPLDGECNPLIEGRRDPVRCLVASARICLEGRPGAAAFTRATFERQATLTREQVFELAAPHLPRRELEACVASADARRKLEDDVALASRFDSDGTPIVVVNGRKGTSFGPFLFAMVLTGGADAHPAFAALPPPEPRARTCTEQAPPPRRRGPRAPSPPSSLPPPPPSPPPPSPSPSPPSPPFPPLLFSPPPLPLSPPPPPPAARALTPPSERAGE